jgi:hypothetical protein
LDTDRGLANSKDVSGGAKTALLGHGNEGSKLGIGGVPFSAIKVHNVRLSYIKIYSLDLWEIVSQNVGNPRQKELFI